MRWNTKALIAVLLIFAVNANADLVRTRPTGGSSGGVTPGSVFVGQIVAPAADNCTSPPYSFSGDLNTGVCTATADNLSLRTAGTNQVTVNATTVTSTVPIITTGTAAAPNFGRSGDTDDGILLGEISYFTRDGVENIGHSGSGALSSLRFCTSGAANCGTQETLEATTAGIRWTDLILTASTMAAESTGILSTSTHSYTWTNAQVAALGATTTGDINVATLPAKTQVLDAMVVITGAASGPTTVTVSCGDAIAGTPFINYVVASDAKAAANTVYGDAVAERGTSLDAEFWYLPSYTATTLVTCHFISSGGNLSTVTGSTGRVVLSTRLLP
jgi:hypothetical protein